MSDLIDHLYADVANFVNIPDVPLTMCSGFGYSALLKSALDADGIPYDVGYEFTDDRDLQCFLKLQRAGLAMSDFPVRDVRPIPTQMGATVNVQHGEKLLFKVDDPARVVL